MISTRQAKETSATIIPKPVISLSVLQLGLQHHPNAKKA